MFLWLVWETRSGGGLLGVVSNIHGFWIWKEGPGWLAARVLLYGMLLGLVAMRRVVRLSCGRRACVFIRRGGLGKLR